MSGAIRGNSVSRLGLQQLSELDERSELLWGKPREQFGGVGPQFLPLTRVYGSTYALAKIALPGITRPDLRLTLNQP